METPKFKIVIEPSESQGDGTAHLVKVGDRLPREMFLTENYTHVKITGQSYSDLIAGVVRFEILRRTLPSDDVAGMIGAAQERLDAHNEDIREELESLIAQAREVEANALGNAGDVMLGRVKVR
jgi:hypothetical protein